MERFYTKYYSDTSPRTLLLGINPGRYGASLTGVGFTDPVLMEQKCGIVNDLEKRSKLSAGFICDVVDAYRVLKLFTEIFSLRPFCLSGYLKTVKITTITTTKRLWHILSRL